MSIVQYPAPPTFTTAIKSIQPFTIALAAAGSNTATITSVNTSKAYIVYGGAQLDSTAAGGGAHNWFCELTLTNATTVTAARGGNTGTVTVAGTVVEFL